MIPFSRLRKKCLLNFFLQPKTFFQYSSPLFVRFFFCKSTWRWQIWKTKKWVILYSTINNVLLLLNIYTCVKLAKNGIYNWILLVKLVMIFGWHQISGKFNFVLQNMTRAVVYKNCTMYVFSSLFLYNFI